MDLNDLKSPIVNVLPKENLIKIIETLALHTEVLIKENALLKEEIEQLKNHIRDKLGEPKPPKFRPKGNKPEGHHRPKEERDRGKKTGPKKVFLEIDRNETLKINNNSLPGDAIFKGYRSIVIQELSIKRDNVKFIIPTYYSPSLGKTFEAAIPTGYKGYEFGPNVRSLIITLATQLRGTEKRIHSILESLGIHISTGEVSNILQDIPQEIKVEFAEAREVATELQGYVQLDWTGIKIVKEDYNVMAFCNQFFTAYELSKSNSRYEALRNIIGDREAFFLFDSLTMKKINDHKQISVPKAVKKIIEQLCRDGKLLSEDEVESILGRHLQDRGANLKIKNLIRFSALHSAYSLGLNGYVCRSIVTDDAQEFKNIFPGHQLCWIHEIRRYRTIKALVGYSQEILDKFFSKIWKYYDLMSGYWKNPTEEYKNKILSGFKEIFETSWRYGPIDNIRENTINRKEGLLYFLKFPHIPIENNQCESDIKEKVIKRKIIINHKSIEGCKNANFWLGLYSTLKKNSVTLFEFLKDRFEQINYIDPLPALIQAHF